MSAKIESRNRLSTGIVGLDEVLHGDLTQKIMCAVEKYKPQRVGFDSTTQFRYLATAPYQYHTQVLSFPRFLQEQVATCRGVCGNSSGYQRTQKGGNGTMEE